MKQKLCISLIISLCACSRIFSAVAENEGSSWARQCNDWDDWDKPGPPFRLFGNSYYVGTCGIASILIVGVQGHVLIDGGTEAGAALIARNIEVLGFRPADIKLILHSHEHFDHVGGLAELQQITGARVLASSLAAPVLRTGVSSSHDPQAGMHEPFSALTVDGIVEPGRSVSVGELEFFALSTPGHSPGALSWQWSSCEKARCLDIVYADSLSPVSSETYRFSDHPAYLQSYRDGLKALAKLDCDLLVTPHPSASAMPSRLTSSRGLIDSDACRLYSQRVGKRLDARLARERESQPNSN